MTGILQETRRSLPPGALALACHAAVPVAVDPGFLHLLRVNFFLDPPAALPYEVEAALLTSPLFRELGDDLYEVDPALRDRLLAALTAAYGPERLTRVAMLLEQYTNRADPWPLRELEYAQRLTALSIVDPDLAASWLASSADQAAPLNREWHVAMRTRLDHRPLDLAIEIDRAVLARDSETLAELLQLPGVDAPAVRQHIEDLDERPAADDRPSLLELIGAAELDDERLEWIRTVERRLSALSTRAPLITPLGRSPGGEPVNLRLAPDGLWHGAIVGAAGSGRTSMALTIALGLAINCSPEWVVLAFLDSLRVGPPEFEQLPHTVAALRPHAGDRPLASVRAEMNRRLALGWSGPHLVVVVNDYERLLAFDPDAREVLDELAASGGAARMALLIVAQDVDAFGDGPLASRITFRISMPETPGAEAHLTTATAEWAFRPALLGAYPAIIERLAAYDQPALRFGPADEDVSLLQLLGLDDAGAGDLTRLRERNRRLTAPIGVADDGDLIALELRAAAEPNCLIIGAAQSGKSELLRTLVLSLALTHPPEEVTFALVSAAGGVTFSDLGPLPHVVSAVTPAGVPDLVDDLTYEVNRRARLAQRGVLTGPRLVIVVEDHDLLLAAQPRLIEALAGVLRAGPELGLHVILAGERFEEEQLASHFGLRIATRLGTEAESTAVLGVPDAARLPVEVGYALLAEPRGEAIRFRVAHVGRAGGAFAVERLVAADAPAARLASRPPVPTTLGAVLGGAEPAEGRGYQLTDAGLWSSPALPVTASPGATADDDRVRWIAVDRSIAVLGPPGSGKTVALETLICGLAVTRTPEQARIHLIAPRDPGILRLARLPHVTVAAGRSDVVLTYRAFAEIRALLESETAATADTYVVVDGLHHLAQRYPELTPIVAWIITWGTGHRVHLIAAGHESEKPFRDLNFPQHVRLHPDSDDPMPLLPTLAPDESTPGDDSEAIVRLAARHWTGPLPARPAMPGATVSHEVTPAPKHAALGFPIGVALLDPGLDRVVLDLFNSPVLIVTGAPGSGKRSFLRALAATIDLRFTADSAMILRDSAGDPSFADVVSLLESRRPGPDVTLEQLRTRSWWRGPEVFVLARDERTVRPFLGLLPDALEVGLHVIVARETPVGSRLEDRHYPELLLSGGDSPSRNIAAIDLPPGVGRLVARDGGITPVQLSYVPPEAR